MKFRFPDETELDDDFFSIETTEKIFDFLKGKCRLGIGSIDRNLFNHNIQLDLNLIIRDLYQREYKELLEVIKNDDN